jgi:pyruvate formate lyase activating enzyme
VVFRGWQKTSLIEVPGRIATVLFVGGCNLRCPWCHNPELALGRAGDGGIEEEQVIAHLERSRKWCQAVAVTGGEPCLSPGLEGFLRRVRALGLLAALETNGTRPQVLARLLEQGLLDYVALDVKAPRDAALYGRATGAVLPDVVEQVCASLRLLAASDVEVELRTTAVPGLHGRAELLAVAQWLRSLGGLPAPGDAAPQAAVARAAASRRWVLQPFIPRRTLDPSLSSLPPFSRQVLEDVAREVGAGVEVR